MIYSGRIDMMAPKPRDDCFENYSNEKKEIIIRRSGQKAGHVNQFFQLVRVKLS